MVEYQTLLCCLVLVVKCKRAVLRRRRRTASSGPGTPSTASGARILHSAAPWAPFICFWLQARKLRECFALAMIARRRIGCGRFLSLMTAIAIHGKSLRLALLCSVCAGTHVPYIDSLSGCLFYGQRRVHVIPLQHELDPAPGVPALHLAHPRVQARLRQQHVRPRRPLRAVQVRRRAACLFGARCGHMPPPPAARVAAWRRLPQTADILFSSWCRNLLQVCQREAGALPLGYVGACFMLTCSVRLILSRLTLAGRHSLCRVRCFSVGARDPVPAWSAPTRRRRTWRTPTFAPWTRLASSQCAAAAAARDTTLTRCTVRLLWQTLTTFPAD